MVSSKPALTPSRKSGGRSRGFFLLSLLPPRFSCLGNHHPLPLVNDEQPTKASVEPPFAMVRPLIPIVKVLGKRFLLFRSKEAIMLAE